MANKRKGPTDPKSRVTLYLHERAMAVLGVVNDSAGVNAALKTYAELIVEATDRLNCLLSSEDWTFLARLLVGISDWETRRNESLAYAIREEIGTSAHAFDFAKELWPKKTQVAIDQLRHALTQISELQAHALLITLNYFWGLPPHRQLVEKWWEPANRIRRSARLRNGMDD